ncbi:MAG: hypothetical protein ACFFDW_05320 [Candidatus Thorarchaeota archaeon]
MSSTKQYQMMAIKAIFIAALTRNGPEILNIKPSLNISEKDLKELAFKCIPMGGKDGDFISVSIPNYQASCLLNQVPPFPESMDDRDTFLSFGMLLEENANPIPYRDILQRIAKTCKENNLLTFEIMKQITNHLVKSITITNECTFTLEIKKGVHIEFELLDTLAQNNHVTKKEEKIITEKLFIGVLSKEEVLEREKSSFVLDKTILKTICSEGPVSLDDLRRKTLPLEDVLGMKIDISTIEEIINRYIKQGIIKSINKE